MEWIPQPPTLASLFVGVLTIACLAFMPAKQAWAKVTDLAEGQPILAPAPGLSPQDVVSAQLIGLQRAADPGAPAEAGMRVVWNFAAPANREVTGPFERFDAMVRAAPYGVLVGHATHDIAHVKRDPERQVAQALVAVTHGQDEVAWFIWVLSKPAEGEAAGCWVTDAVYPVQIDNDPTDPGSIV